MKKLVLTIIGLGLIASPAVTFGQEGTFKPGQTTEANRQIQPGKTSPAGQSQPANQAATGQAIVNGTAAGTVVTGTVTTTTQEQPTANATYGNKANQDGQKKQQNRLQSILATGLINANKGEIELGKMAQQRAENDQVKAFAQHMVEQHSKVVEKLTSFKSSLNSNDSDSKSTDGNKKGQNKLAGQGNGQNQNNAQAQNATPAPLTQLVSIMQDTCKKNLEMTKNDLSNMKGKDFDMAYIGQQCGAHTAMLAQLQALKGIGNQDMQALVEAATKETQEHLNECKKIAMDLNKNS